MRNSLRAWTVAMLAGLAASSCGDSTGSVGGDGGSDAGVGDLSTGNDLASTDATSAIDLSSADAGPCPDVFGAYTVSVSGQGCGDLNASAPQCIAGTGTACVAHFISAPPTGTGAVNGQAMLQMDGSFSGAALIFGTVQRSGCVGTWNAATSTLTADCGGMGSSQSCVVTLTRTGTTCP